MSNFIRTEAQGNQIAYVIEQDGDYVFICADKQDNVLASHRLPVQFTDEQRLQAHWEGFCRNNGIFIFRPQLETALKGDPFYAITGSAESWKKHLKGRY
jgi:hypothetical protein